MSLNVFGSLVDKTVSFLNKSLFLKNVLFLAGGTILAQLFLLLISPILTRLYLPEDFGGLAIFTSLLAILSVISTLRYEMAIPLCKGNKLAFNLATFCFLLLVSVSLVVGVLVFIFRDDVIPSLQLSEKLYWLLPIAIIAYSLFQVLHYLAIKHSHFKKMSQATVLQQMGVGTWQLSAGYFFQAGALGLILGLIFGKLIGVFRLLDKKYMAFRSVSFNKMRLVAIRNKKFPIYFTWASLINVVGLQAAPLIFTFYFDLKVAGFIALTMKILGVPSALVGEAVGKVFYNQAATNAANKTDNKQLVEKLVTLLFLVGFPAFLMIGFYGADGFAIIFGENWRQAGEFSQYLSPWLFVCLISSPLSSFALVTGMQKKALMITLYETASRVFVLFMGALYLGVEITVMMYSAVGFIISMVYITWVLRLAGSGIIEWLALNKQHILKACGLVILLLISKLFTASIVLLVTLCILLAIFYYFSLMSTLKTMKLDQ